MNDNLPPGVTLNDVDPPEMDDDPRLMYDTSHVKDTSDWHSGTCECCGGPTRWRWTGLRAVADTGDERMASKDVVSERDDVTGLLLAACKAALARDGKIEGWQRMQIEAAIARAEGR